MQNFNQRVNFLSIAVEAVERIDAGDGISSAGVESQLQYRRDLIEEIQKQIIDFETKEDQSNPLIMPAKDLI